MIENRTIHNIPFGGDYNPEQWPEETWPEDMRLMKQAGVNTVTLNVFSWAALQPYEDVYDFRTLDKIMELTRKNNLKVCLATSTGAHPAWMAKKYPDILRTEFGGIRRKFGGRHNSCPNSPTYRKFSVALAARLAARYRNYDNIVAWHVANEYGGTCYCENCERAFRVWLKKKYGTLEALNRAWNTAFWSHTFYDWDEIVAPDTRSEHIDRERTMFQGISLDYQRFQSDSILECYQLERDAIRAVLPDASITTNLMGFYKELDYQKWAKEMDFISWDNYPANEDSYADIAMAHDLMRGIKQGQPFALMEQTPSVTNWLPYNALKRPGVMRLWSYQAMAHGADTVMFFQMKRSVGACEKYHGALIDHAGTEHTRVYREMQQLGQELEQLGDRTLGARTDAKIGMIFNWDNWWSVEYSAGPSCELRYLTEFKRFYSVLREMNYDVDILSPEDDFSGYRVLIAPVWYMIRGREDEAVRRFVAEGGTFITTFFSGYVQENDLVTLGGYPGKLRDILGIWVEESDALPHNGKNAFCYHGRQYPAMLLCDLLHLETAEQVDSEGYETDFYRGFPVITRNSFGKGKAYYIATASKPAFYRAFLSDICDEADVEPVLTTPEGIEVSSRTNEKGT
ncbi:beta-galactosidase, partial [Butyricicoccus sp.]|uniref:beta-galactosidase n=1 Tax=Butyricicoccus sp. TaxID=2049021 RepID=UPI003F15B7F6